MKLLRFTLRDLFWLVLVVGMGCAWWLERQEKLAALQRSYQLEFSAHELVSHLELLEWDAQIDNETGRVEFLKKKDGSSFPNPLE